MPAPKNTSTPKQFAYAQNKLAGRANTKFELAKLSGYSNTIARRPKEKIEESDGFKNAMHELALRSNNVLLKVLAEFDRRDITEFTNKDIISAVNAITSSWAKIDTQRQMSKHKDPDKNPLRSLFMNRSEVLTIKSHKPKPAKIVRDNTKELENRKEVKEIKKLDL